MIKSLTSFVFLFTPFIIYLPIYPFITYLPFTAFITYYLFTPITYFTPIYYLLPIYPIYYNLALRIVQSLQIIVILSKLLIMYGKRTVLILRHDLKEKSISFLSGFFKFFKWILPALKCYV